MSNACPREREIHVRIYLLEQGQEIKNRNCRIGTFSILGAFIFGRLPFTLDVFRMQQNLFQKPKMLLP